MKNKLYGAILGDLAGQPYEFKYNGDYSEFNLHDKRSHITDDSILTLATAAALLDDVDFRKMYILFGNEYDSELFGKGFRKWVKDQIAMEGDFIGESYANGCLMRISPIFYIRKSREEIRELLVKSCLCSHNHPQSILAVLDLGYYYWTNHFYSEYYQNREERDFKKFDKFDVTAKGTIEFIKQHRFSSLSTHLAIEKTVKCGGDTDTNASIMGELYNHTYNDLTDKDVEYVRSKLDNRLLSILDKFNEKFK